jgi:hypothetical protein
VDVELDSRVKLIQVFEADMMAYVGNLRTFTDGALEMIENQAMLADAIWALYEHSAMKYYARDLKV